MIPLVTVDTETTGKDVERDRIVQIALVMPDRRERKTLINPGIPIPPGATKVHGITDEMVKDAPPFSSIADKVKEALDGAGVCGFKSRTFDVEIINAELVRCGRFKIAPAFNLDVLDTARKVEGHSLAAIYKRKTGKDLTEAHDAAADARATIEVLHALMAEYPELPRDYAELAKYVEPEDLKRWADPQGSLIRNEDGVICVNVGKRKGEPLSTLNAKLLRWMLDGEFFSDTAKTHIRAAFEIAKKAEGWMDDNGKLILKDNVIYVNFGKSKGKPLHGMSKRWVDFIVDADFIADDVKAIIRKVHGVLV